ncbi:TonB-dependent siderophore receptor [Pseudoxanthomonas sp.]|uniref:TonB-dependent siderophore receptor n=1 Tax=Pseudoxanthomonas sp. TaxID=1871049 RepID=UPI002608B16D|nr:TonB-dependent siderophore receptor [Pseudoxanthomonas sp.]WDS37466.1 MAG: TonB-dependent siderophore receptor [Pseudoxanthomonas sp.]
MSLSLHTVPCGVLPRFSALAVACLLGCTALSAGAQESTSTTTDATTMDAVRVNAYRTSTSTSSATKTNTVVAETPQSVSVIARDEMDARNTQTLNDVMRYVAGVSLESTGIDNRVDDFRIRGFDAGSWSDNVTLDGMRAPQGSQWNRSSFDTWNLERVEVLKGPSAVMYGQVAPGGMVNQVSKLPQPHQKQQLRVGVDANGQASTAFDLGTGSTDDTHLFRLVGLYRDGQTQIDQVDQKRWFLAPSYTWQVSDDTRLTLLGMYQKDTGGSTYQFLPMSGTLNATQYGRMKNTTFIGDPDWNTYDRTQWNAGWLFEHAFNEHWTLSQSARHTHVDSLFRSVIISGALNSDGRTQARRATWGTGDSDGNTVDTHLKGQFDTGAIAHTVLVGVDYQKADWDGQRGTMANPASIDIFNPVYTSYTPVTTAIALSEGTDTQTGVYAQDQLALDKWRLSFGGRYDWTKDTSSTATYTVASDTTTAWTRTSVKDEAFTGRAGLLYVADNGFTPYVSYSESFQPSITDINLSYTQTQFKPITGKQWEAGVKYQPTSFDGLITLSAYDLRQQNILSDDPDATHNTCGSTGVKQCQVQNGEGRVRGVELEGRITPITGFSLIGAVSRMDSEMLASDDGYAGNQLAQVPDWTASAWADYTFQTGSLSGLSLAAGVRYTGVSYGDSANLYKIPSYTLFDAAIRYDVGRIGGIDTQLSLNASNLTDKVYVSTCTAVAACHYGSGRAVMANARFSW